MWQHRHTATVILVLAAGTARADFTDSVWNDLFATERMAAECHSGRVERCAAVGVTPTSPTWWDYLTGKNRAKIISVKTDIQRIYKRFLDPTKADSGQLFVTHLNAHGTNDLSWGTEAEFLAACGLPANTLADTPWFKLQYTNTPGGWHAVKTCLEHLIVTKERVDWHPNVWTNLWMPREEIIGESSNSFSSLPIVSALGGVAGIGPSHLLDITSPYEFEPYYGMDIDVGLPWGPLPLVLYFVENESYFRNARGTWTTAGSEYTWATNWALCTNGVRMSFSYGSDDWPAPPEQDEYGMSWQYPFVGYMVKARPRAVFAGAHMAGSNATYALVTNEVIVAVTNYAASNLNWEIQYEESERTRYITNITDQAVYRVETNGYVDVTNMVPTGMTNLVVTTNATIIPDTSVFGRHSVTSWAGFGTRHIGTKWDVTNVIYAYGPFRVTNAVAEVQASVTNVPVTTNIFEGFVQVTNIEEEVYVDQGDITNIVYFWEWDTNSTAVVTETTNEVVTEVTNLSAVSYYAAGATQIRGYPYAGTTPYYLTKGIPGFSPSVYPGENLYDMTPLWTGAEHRVDFYYHWVTPTNVPPVVPPETWHEHYGAFTNELSLTATFNDFEIGLTGAGWFVDQAQPTTADIVFGEQVDVTPGDLFSISSFDNMMAIYATQFAEPPGRNEIQTIGMEVAEEFAAVWWNGTNGFKWK